MTTSAHEHSARLADLLRRERAALAEFLVALADFDERKLWIELGYASLFDYLHRDLGLSKAASFYRLTAARLVQRHPAIVEPLRDGRLCFSSVVELSKVLTAENLPEVLPRFFHLSKREAKAITAELRPAASVPMREVVTMVRTDQVAPSLSLATWAVAAIPTAPASAGSRPIDPSQAPVHPGEPTAPSEGIGNSADSRRRVLVDEPLTAELTRLHITVPRRLLRKLDQAREVLSHSRPGASADEVIEAGLDLLIERHAKRRGLVQKPRKARAQASARAAEAERNSEAAAPGAAGRHGPGGTHARKHATTRRRDHVPAHVKREVWKRDGGRCQWKLSSGGICGSTHRVQIDHVVPVARGGASTADELRCLCDVHNDLAARQAFGDAWMDRFTRRGRERRTAGRSEARSTRRRNGAAAPSP